VKIFKKVNLIVAFNILRIYFVVEKGIQFGIALNLLIFLIDNDNRIWSISMMEGRIFMRPSKRLKTF
jgi:hypothetical protein